MTDLLKFCNHHSFIFLRNLGDDGSPAAVLASSEQENSYSALSTAQLDPSKWKI